tara:strand:- start:326 stop:910 length:585 start_codon:yes stop_codon:yes gene_type:complete
MAKATETKVCEYSATVWNVAARKSVRTIKIFKPYSSITKKERGPFGCTPCLVDQVDIELPFVKSFKACKFIAEKIKSALSNAHYAGFPIYEVEGYRASYSKGKPDQLKNRTELSNHAFGTAIDVNTNHNGLYDKCVQWSSDCRLIKGGKRDLSKQETITENSPLYYEMKRIGLKWGGEIQGLQKDFMHFSETGY